MTMAKNGYAVYLFNASEIQWITVAEAFLLVQITLIYNKFCCLNVDLDQAVNS